MIKFSGKLSGDQNPQSEKSKIAEDISIAAHQLRHPISVIKSYLEALISEDLGKLNLKQIEYVEDALRTHYLLAVIERSVSCGVLFLPSLRGASLAAFSFCRHCEERLLRRRNLGKLK